MRERSFVIIQPLACSIMKYAFSSTRMQGEVRLFDEIMIRFHPFFEIGH